MAQSHKVIVKKNLVTRCVRATDEKKKLFKGTAYTTMPHILQKKKTFLVV